MCVCHPFLLPQLSCAGSPVAASQHHRPSPPSPLQGDTFVSGRGVCAGTVPAEVCDVAKDINVALGTSSSVPTRKRRLSHSGSADDALQQQLEMPPSVVTPTLIPTASEPFEQHESTAETPDSTWVESAEARADGSFGRAAEALGDDGEDAAPLRGEADDPCADAGSGLGVQCSPVPSRLSRRTLYIEYWSRTDECKERKWDHLDEIADKYGAPEDHIFDTTLRGRTACLEPNMFPYNTPAGIEHWTLWHVKELNHSQIKQYVENWIDANAPHVESWNYDDNPERSIDIFHVHVYLQVPESMTVLQGRAFDDLEHEMD